MYAPAIWFFQAWSLIWILEYGTSLEYKEDVCNHQKYFCDLKFFNTDKVQFILNSDLIVDSDWKSQRLSVSNSKALEQIFTSNCLPGWLVDSHLLSFTQQLGHFLSNNFIINYLRAKTDQNKWFRKKSLKEKKKEMSKI